MEAIKINNKKFFRYLMHLINALSEFNSEIGGIDNELDDLDEIFITKSLTKQNTSFLYIFITHFENNPQDEKIAKEFRHMKKILNKHFNYDLKIENGTANLEVSNKNEG